jgi:hypothetical protein
MRITIREILDADKISLACVPIKGKVCVSIHECESEKKVLEQFTDVLLDVDAKALPLSIYLMGGNERALAIFPSPGGRIRKPKNEITLEKPGYQLNISPTPLH